MKKIILLLLFITTTISAQITTPVSFCATDTDYILPDLSSIDLARRTNICNLKVYIHIIRRSNGTGMFTRTDAVEALGYLDRAYNPHGIFFNYENIFRIDYIDDDALYNLALPRVFDINNHEDGIDIYFFGADNDNPGSLAGWPSSATNPIPSDLYLTGGQPGNINEPIAKTNVIAHEMGHVLGLWHTHRGCESGDYELIDGSNSATAGDLVTDTPADPNIFFQTNRRCDFIPQPVSFLECDQPEPREDHDPDTKNFMSYAPPKCLNRFSNGQVARMNNAIETLQHLINATVDCNPNPSCSDFPKIFENTNYKLSNLWTDHLGNIYVKAGRQDQNLTHIIEGVNVPYPVFLAKYNENGCLEWVNEVEDWHGPKKLKTDSSGNIFTLSSTSRTTTGSNDRKNTLSFFNSNYISIWDYSFGNDIVIIDFSLLPNGEILILTNNYNTNQLSIHRMNGFGNITQSQNLVSSSNLGYFYNFGFFSSEDGKEIYISTAFNEGEINFGSNTMNHDGNNNGDRIILKYQYSFNSFIPSSYKYIQEFHQNSKTLFNRSTKNIFLISSDEYVIYNGNLNIINNGQIPLLNSSSQFYIGNSMLNQFTNTLITLDTDGVIYQMIDDGTFSFTVTESELMSFNFLNNHSYSFIIKQAPSRLLYSIGGNGNQTSLVKLDPNTGQLLARTNNTKKIEENTITKKEKTSFITLYPNPTKNTITITSEKEIKQIQVLSKIGLPIINKNKVSKNEIIVNLDKLPIDIYIVKVLFKDGTSEEQKLLKK